MNARAEPQEVQLDQWSRIRIHVAGQIAAGLANPENRVTPGWESSVARSSVLIADAIIRTVLGGHA